MTLAFRRVTALADAFGHFWFRSFVWATPRSSPPQPQWFPHGEEEVLQYEEDIANWRKACQGACETQTLRAAAKAQEAFKAGGWAGVNFQALDLETARGGDNSGVLAGTEHTTGSGTLSWEVRPDGTVNFVAASGWIVRVFPSGETRTEPCIAKTAYRPQWWGGTAEAYCWFILKRGVEAVGGEIPFNAPPRITLPRGRRALGRI